jgi:excisionase family DNA binding protein
MEVIMDRRIKLLTIEDAAGRLGISAEAVWDFVRDGKLTASRIDGRCVCSEMQLLFFRNNHRVLLERETRCGAVAC